MAERVFKPYIKDRQCIEEVEYHRNGVSGEGFYIVKFIDHEFRPFVAIVFSSELQEHQQGRIAVFNRDKLKQDEYRFFYNSWRGDWYEPMALEAIRNYRIQMFGPDVSDAD